MRGRFGGANPDLGYIIVGYLDDLPESSSLHEHILGGLDNLHEILATHKVDEVIIAIPMKLDKKIIRNNILFIICCFDIVGPSC